MTDHKPNAEATTLLTRMLTSHAYRERLAAEQFRQAVHLAPTEAARIYIQGVASEETEHFQLCLAAAETLGLEIAEAVEARMAKAPPGIPVFGTWLDVLLAHALNDEAGLFVLRGLATSRVEAYATLAKHIIDDELLHGSRGRSMLLAYWPTAQDSRQAKHEKFIEHLDAGVRCLGRPDTPSDKLAIAFGLKTTPARDLIRAYCSYADDIVAALDLPGLLPTAQRYLEPVAASAN
jgi:1,2-phenylacetyl-CoA epoxidase catalytic subunit